LTDLNRNEPAVPPDEFARRLRDRNRPPANRVVTAQEFRLVDAADNHRGTFGCLNDGTAGLFLEGQQYSVVLVARPNGGVAMSLARDGVTRIMIHVTPPGTPTLELSDGAGVPRLSVRLTTANEPQIRFTDAQGNDRVVLP
jgi:hypothetical protein